MVRQRIVAGGTLAIAILACQSQATPPAEVTYALSGGQMALVHTDAAWLQGDTHVHSMESTDADMRSTPTLIRDTALAQGLEWVVITDHSNATGSRAHCLDDPEPNDCVEQEHLHNLKPEFPTFDTTRSLSDDQLVMVTGNEASPVDLTNLTPRGHVNVVPRDPAQFDTDWVIADRPSGAVSGGAAIVAAHAHDAMAILNHPFSPGGATPWVEFDWTNMDYDAVEIYNGGGGYDSGDQRGFVAALCDWTQGHPVAFVGASDNHRTFVPAPGDLLNPALGDARTSVLVAELSWPAIVAALQARRTIAHDKASFLEMRATVAGTRYLPGDVVELAHASRVELELGGWTDEPAEVEVLAALDGACTDGRGRSPATVEVAWDVVAAFPLASVGPEAGQQPDRFVTTLDVEPGTTLVARIKRSWKELGQRGQAIASPIRFAAAP